jgi:hypothetical protein
MPVVADNDYDGDPDRISRRMANNQIFVFGSELAGRHGEGTALRAWKHHGAIRGKGDGPMGMAYAIAVRDSEQRTLHLDTIKKHVDRFLGYACRNDNLKFFVTAIGTDAGYADAEMARLFADAPVNCELPEEWAHYIKMRKRR